MPQLCPLKKKKKVQIHGKRSSSSVTKQILVLSNFRCHFFHLLSYWKCQVVHFLMLWRLGGARSPRDWGRQWKPEQKFTLQNLFRFSQIFINALLFSLIMKWNSHPLQSQLLTQCNLMSSQLQVDSVFYNTSSHELHAILTWCNLKRCQENLASFISSIYH